MSSYYFEECNDFAPTMNTETTEINYNRRVKFPAFIMFNLYHTYNIHCVRIGDMQQTKNLMI